MLPLNSQRLFPGVGDGKPYTPGTDQVRNYFHQNTVSPVMILKVHIYVLASLSSKIAEERFFPLALRRIPGRFQDGVLVTSLTIGITSATGLPRRIRTIDSPFSTSVINLDACFLNSVKEIVFINFSVRYAQNNVRLIVHIHKYLASIIFAG